MWSDETARGGGRTSVPVPSASVVIAVCVACALAVASDGVGVGGGGLLGGAATSAAGEAMREPIYDDVPFEDDHVEFRVPRIEREIAAEEIGGEEPWTRVASRGVFEDDAASSSDRARESARATYAALGRRRYEDADEAGDFKHTKSHHRHHRERDDHDDDEDDSLSLRTIDFQLPGFETASDKERKERESGEIVSKLHAQERESEKLQRFFENVDSGVDSGVRAMMDGREHRSRADLGKDTSSSSSFNDMLKGLQDAMPAPPPPASSTLKKSSLVSALENTSDAMVKKLDGAPTKDSSSATTAADSAQLAPTPAKSPHADKRQEGRNFINDGVSDDEVLKTFMEGGTLEPVRAAVKENKSSPTPSPSPSPSPSPAPVAAESAVLAASESTVVNSTSVSNSSAPVAAESVSLAAAQPTVVNSTSTSNSAIPTAVVTQPVVTQPVESPSTQTPVADDESYTDVEYDENGNAHVVSGKDATASTGASQGAAKKKIDTTADIALYENAFRDQRDRSERSWAQKGLKEADEKILTEENIKRNELAGDQSLPLDFLSHFPVVLPKTARETQQWKRYAPQHVIAVESKNVKEKAEKEALERIKETAVEVVRTERKQQNEQERQHTWKDMVFSLYFVGPLGLAAFVSIFYATVVLVVRKVSNESSKNDGNEPDDDATFDDFVRTVSTAALPKLAEKKKRCESDGGLAASIFGMMKKTMPMDELTKLTMDTSNATQNVDGDDASTSEQTWMQSTMSESGPISNSPSGMSTPYISTSASAQSLDGMDRVLDKGVISKTLQSIRTSTMSSPERVRKVRSNDVTAELSRQASPTAAGDANATLIAPQQSESANAQQADQPPRPDPAARRALYESRQPPPAPPRRPGDAPQIVRSTTTKFY
tara:strand:- start:713 stop:3379 length:2667 start_codon:yes stop_codon:yes gene_type:complete